MIDFNERISLDVRVPASALIPDVEQVIQEQAGICEIEERELDEQEAYYFTKMYPSIADTDVPQLPPFSPPHNDLQEAQLQRIRENYDIARQTYRYYVELLEYLNHDPERLVSMNVRSLFFYYTDEERRQPNSLFNNLEPDDDEVWGNDDDDDDWDDEEWENLVDDV